MLSMTSFFTSVFLNLENDIPLKSFCSLMSLISLSIYIKNIGDKIDEKIKSGEIKESELMSEGMELLNKMQTMPGMGDMQKMFSQMGIPGLGKGAKMNMGAMEAQLNKNMKSAKMKERMQAKAQANKTQAQAQANKADPSLSASPAISEEDIIKIFSTGEKVEKTPRGSKPATSKAPLISEPIEPVKKDKKKKKK